MNEKYTDVNSKVIDYWVENDWEWGTPITHETFLKAKEGKWNVVLTPIIPVPHNWFPQMKGAKVLGLASGGGQQMPIFAALGADCTVIDNSAKQLEQEKIVSKREGYSINIVKGDMSKPLPFENEQFDLIFNPVSICYIEQVESLFKECSRILKKGGTFLVALDNGVNYVYNEEETEMLYKLPFNPLKDKKLYEDSISNNWGIQFSHTMDEQMGGLIRAGFSIEDIYQDTNGYGKLHEFGVPTFYSVKAIKK